MEFAKGETVEWIIADKGHLILARKDTVLHHFPEALRTAASNQHLPAVTVAAYALLWVAALLARTASPPPPAQMAQRPPRNRPPSIHR